MNDKKLVKKLEELVKTNHLDTSYEEWVRNFSLNLGNIWIEKSARNLDPNYMKQKEIKSAIVIGAGPSLKKHSHLNMLAASNFQGAVICTDRTLIPALKAGVTPEKFPNFYVVTIDGDKSIKKFYEDDIIKKYGSKINGIFTTVTNPLTVNEARKRNINIHWLHALFDYEEGRKSFNHISALMVRAKNHDNGLPAIQTGGNVGTSCWFIAWKILRCSIIGLIGIDHSWSQNESWDSIMTHCNISKEQKYSKTVFHELFPKIYNPFFECTCILDPIFQYYSRGLKEFIAKSPPHIQTINATEGGCIFGDRITCMKFEQFLRDSTAIALK